MPDQSLWCSQCLTYHKPDTVHAYEFAEAVTQAVDRLVQRHQPQRDVGRALLLYKALCSLAAGDGGEMIADILGDGRVFEISVKELSIEDQ